MCPCSQTEQTDPVDSLLAEVVPLALGAAVSPAALTIELLILTGARRPKVSAWLYVLGAGVTIFAFGYLAVTVFRTTHFGTDAGVNPWDVGLKAVIALILVALGVRELRPRTTPAAVHQNRVATALATAKTPYFLLGGVLAMLTNFSTLVLYIPAAQLIARSGDPVGTRLAAGTLLWLITMTPLLIPVIAATVAGQRADAVLGRINAWTYAHTRQINAGIAFLFAALIGWSAAAELFR